MRLFRVCCVIYTFVDIQYTVSAEDLNVMWLVDE